MQCFMRPKVREMKQTQIGQLMYSKTGQAIFAANRIHPALLVPADQTHQQ